MVCVSPVSCVASRWQRARVVSCRAGALSVVETWRTTRPHRLAAGKDDLRSLAESDPNAAWVNVALVGSYAGHPAGEFEFNADAFGQMIANFAARETPVPWKYEHPPGNGEPAPTAGKVAALEMRGDRLYALSIFTDRAAEMIRSGEYSYCSGVFVFDAVDAKSGDGIGCELLEIGLTDTPFIDGLEPIELREMTP